MCGDDERLESSDDDSLEDSLDVSDELDEITLDGLTLFAGFRPTGAEEGFPVDFFVELAAFESVDGRDSLLFRDCCLTEAGDGLVLLNFF